MTTLHHWTHISFTIDGRRHRIDASGVSYDRALPGTDETVMARVSSSGYYEASFETTIDGNAFDQLLSALMPESPPGASLGTLASRALYGGRKGLSAMRRLVARGYLGAALIAGMPTPITPWMLGHLSRQPSRPNGKDSWQT